MRIIDISQPIHEGMPTYPGTGEVKIEQVKSGSGTSVLSMLQMSSHTGTHVDAPAHTVPGGDPLAKVDLNRFYGPARVLDMTACQESVQTADLQAKDIREGERILLKTNNSKRGFKNWYDDYVYLGPDAAEYLAQLGVRLVGIDSLGIKQRGAKDNTSHTALQSRQIPILEGLDLKNADEGEYILSALPIALQFDGAPTRAVLIIQDDESKKSSKSKLDEAKLFSDGGSRGNPGPSAIAYVICKMDNSVVEKSGEYIGVTTNNQAEYQGLKMGLKKARQLGVKQLIVNLDSELVVKQINGLYKIKNAELLPHFQEVKGLAAQFDEITFQHVPRALNAAADKEVNRILDEQPKG